MDKDCNDLIKILGDDILASKSEIDEKTRENEKRNQERIKLNEKIKEVKN
jgi:hypothetical protein